jgi:hypothetical protein
VEPFVPRPVGFHGLRETSGWQLKLYSVRYGSSPVDWNAFAPGLAMAEATLPRPARAEGRPGVGFLIAHQGRTGDYLVLGWWEQENELPLEVFVNRRGPGESWRPARTRESVCVWDLEIIWAERQAYVATMLRNGESDPAAYLGQVMGRD